MNQVWKKFIRVYSVFSMCLVTLLIIAGLIVWINFGRITGKAIEVVVDSYSDELNTVISGYFEEAAPDSLLKFGEVSTVSGGGLYLSFNVEDSDLAKVDIAKYETMSNIEVINDLGITPSDIPAEIMPILSKVRQTLLIEIKDTRGKLIASRDVTAKEIQEFFKG